MCYQASLPICIMGELSIYGRVERRYWCRGNRIGSPVRQWKLLAPTQKRSKKSKEGGKNNSWTTFSSIFLHYNPRQSATGYFPRSRTLIAAAFVSNPATRCGGGKKSNASTVLFELPLHFKNHCQQTNLLNIANLRNARCPRFYRRREELGSIIAYHYFPKKLKKDWF